MKVLFILKYMYHGKPVHTAVAENVANLTILTFIPAWVSRLCRASSTPRKLMATRTTTDIVVFVPSAQGVKDTHAPALWDPFVGAALRTLSGRREPSCHTPIASTDAGPGAAAAAAAAAAVAAVAAVAVAAAAAAAAVTAAAAVRDSVTRTGVGRTSPSRVAPHDASTVPAKWIRTDPAGLREVREPWLSTNPTKDTPPPSPCCIDGDPTRPDNALMAYLDERCEQRHMYTYWLEISVKTTNTERLDSALNHHHYYHLSEGSQYNPRVLLI